jgi:hypothetical protein
MTAEEREAEAAIKAAKTPAEVEPIPQLFLRRRIAICETSWAYGQTIEFALS